MDQTSNASNAELNMTTSTPAATPAAPEIALPAAGTVPVAPARPEIVDYRAKYDELRAQVAAAAETIERDHGSRWGEEQYNAGARAAAAVVRAILE